MSGDDHPQTFLFLQGPHGAFFGTLAQALIAAGHCVRRVNLNAGDRLDWPLDAINYRGNLRSWPSFFDDLIVAHRVTDVILFGDCRPYHASAHAMAKLRKLRVHVVEEGYIRPDFMTLQDGGVNGNSTLPRDPEWYLVEAQRLPPFMIPAPIPSPFRRRLRESTRYTLSRVLSWPAYPHYRSHRSRNTLAEALGWAMRYLMKKRDERRAAAQWDLLKNSPYFLLPLQLNTDFQLRTHSPFGDMRSALRYVIKSFARSAPPTANLIVKRHPLDSTVGGWAGLIRKLARMYGVRSRVHYLPDGDIVEFVDRSIGLVTVNSTVGTLALNSGIPVAVLGEAIYNLPGLVHRGPLDDFWNARTVPDGALYDAFRRVLIDRCLIPGGYASDEGIAQLTRHAVARLTAAVPPGATDSPGEG